MPQILVWIALLIISGLSYGADLGDSRAPPDNPNPVGVTANLYGPGRMDVYKGRGRLDNSPEDHVPDESYTGLPGQHIYKEFANPRKLKVNIRTSTGGKANIDGQGRRVWSEARTKQRNIDQQVDDMSPRSREKKLQDEAKKYSASTTSWSLDEGRLLNTVSGKGQKSVSRVNDGVVFGEVRGKGQLRVVASNSPPNSPKKKAPSSVSIWNRVIPPLEGNKTPRQRPNRKTE